MAWSIDSLCGGGNESLFVISIVVTWTSSVYTGQLSSLFDGWKVFQSCVSGICTPL